MVGHDTVVVQDNLNNAQQGAEVEKLEREEDQLKKEEKEEEALDVIGRQSVQTGAVGQPNGQAKKATEANKDQALLAQSVTNQQVAGTKSNEVRSKIQQILDRTGKHGKEPDDVNYTAMKEGLKRLDTQLNEPVKQENMLVSWRDLKKTYIWIASAAQQYVNSHKNPFSLNGMSRKYHARALLNLCRSDVRRLDYQIKNQDPTDQQSTWKQLLEKKPGGSNSSTLSVKKLAKNTNTADPILEMMSVTGFKVMTKEQFEVLSGQSMDQLPEKYKNLDSLLDDYSKKLTLGAKGSMQENDDSRATLEEILKLTKQYVKDIREHKTASTGNENPKLVFAMNTLQSQCDNILNPKSDVAASTPANRLHGSLSMPGKVNEEIELQDLLTDKTQKDKPKKADPQAAAVVKEAPKKEMSQPEAPKKVTPQPEAPKKEVPKEAPKVGNQAVPAQNMTVQRGARRGHGLFSKVRHAVDFEALPENYKELGTLIEEYGSLENSRQGGEVLKAKLEKISGLAKDYLLDSTIPKEKRQNTIGVIRYNADVAINKINRGENVLPQNEQQVPRRTTGQLPMPVMKPVAQNPLPPVPPKPVAQKTLPPVPPEPVVQEQPKPVAQEQQEEQPKPVIQEQQEEQPKPVTQETQQTQENQQQQETNTAEGTQQQEDQQQPPQQQPQQQQAQTTEPSGPSMRKTLLDELRMSERLGGGAINPAYKHLITRYEALYQALGDTITEDKQKESWENLKKAYVEVAVLSEQYARVHADAPTAVGRVCRRYARMLLFMCNFDMRTLQIANKNPDLAKKNTTWRQILEQPSAPETQQTEAQQTQAQQTEAQQTETQQTQQTQTQDAVQTNQPKGNPARDFRNLEQQLSNSEKGGLGRKNSKYFNRVMDALEQTAKAMEQGFDRNSMNNSKKLAEASVALRELLTACQAYTARNPRTQSGKIRRDIVLQIQKYASQDFIGCEQALSDFITMSPEDQAKETWMSVIQRARSVQLTVEDLSKLAPEKKGQASEVFKIESGEGDQKTIQYFKKEDSIDVDAVNAKGERAGYEFALQQTLEKYPNLSAKDKKSLQKLNEDSRVSELSKKDFSDEGIEAATYLINRMLQLNKTVVKGYVKHIGIVDEGGTANMTRRNVATSRIADLLGLGKLVAKSRTVEIHDEATGKTIRGNLMDQAEGEEYGKIKDKLKNSEIASGFMRDLTNLQVLDALCGQVDRNTGNMLYKTDNGKLSGVQAIDNDASFGTNTDVLSATVGDYKDARVFDVESGEMVVPYMDDELAQRIENLDSEVVRYVLADLLKEEEIQAFIQRLDKMKEGIQKARKEHPDRFLKGDKAWTLMEEGKPSVERELLTGYNNALIQMDPSTWKKKEMVLSTASEMYKDDPKTLEAIRLFYEDQEAFEKDYNKDERAMLKDEINKVIMENRARQQYKYGANINYFGRVKSSWSGFLRTETVV